MLLVDDSPSVQDADIRGIMGDTTAPAAPAAPAVQMEQMEPLGISAIEIYVPPSPGAAPNRTAAKAFSSPAGATRTSSETVVAPEQEQQGQEQGDPGNTL